MLRMEEQQNGPHWNERKKKTTEDCPLPSICAMIHIPHLLQAYIHAHATKIKKKIKSF